jgi:hypothetical protein
MLRTTALFAILLLGATPAFADKCDNAVSEYNSQLRSESAWWLQSFRETFGATIDDYKGEWSGVAFCTKYLPLLYKRLELEKNIDHLDAVQRAVCGSRFRNTGVAPNNQNYTEGSMVPKFQKTIDSCEATLKGR